MLILEKEKKQWREQFVNQIRHAFEPNVLIQMINSAMTIRDANGAPIHFSSNEELTTALQSLANNEPTYTLDPRASAGLLRAGYSAEEIASMPVIEKVRCISAFYHASGPGLENMNLTYSRMQQDSDDPISLVKDQAQFISTLYQTGKETFAALATIQATKEAKLKMEVEKKANATSAEEKTPDSQPWQRYVGRFR